MSDENGFVFMPPDSDETVRMNNEPDTLTGLPVMGVEVRKNAYTQEEFRILEYMRKHRALLWSASEMANVLYHVSTNSKEYRRVLRAMHKLEEKKLLDTDSFYKVNLTVFWLRERIKNASGES